ncbi:MAG: DNA polymerase III subunit beta, partial [Clostridia bacterium]|nr:DNA polymerase III subunit beta [Clostridia bacterium]
ISLLCLVAQRKGMVIKMKFYCQKDELQKAINIASRAVATKAASPYFEGILLEARERVLYLTGNDLTVSVKTSIEANVAIEGSLVLNAKMFSDIIGKLPDDVVEIKNENDLTVYISCLNSDYKIVGLGADEFPQIETIERDVEIDIEESLLKDMIAKTQYAVSQNREKITLNGTLFDIASDCLTLVAVDGFRMAIRNENAAAAKEGKYIIPARAGNEIVKILSDSDEDKKIHLSFGKKTAAFENEKFIMVTRLIDGEFFAYRQIIPDEFKINIPVDCEELLATIMRCEPVIEDVSKSPIKITLTDGGIKVRCETTRGQVNDFLKCGYDGEEMEIGFNYHYLCDALSRCKGENIILRINSPFNPLIINSDENPSFLFMVLPVRL